MPKEIPVRCYGVSAVVVRAPGGTHEMLLLKRAPSSNGQWCQVAGGIEQGETAWKAAIREITEETGLIPERLYSSDLLEQFYEVDKDAIWIAPVFVAFVGDRDVVQLNDEHTEYEWVPFAQAIARVPFPGQKRILKEIEETFIKGEPPDSLQIVQA